MFERMSLKSLSGALPDETFKFAGAQALRQRPVKFGDAWNPFFANSTARILDIASLK